MIGIFTIIIGASVGLTVGVLLLYGIAHVASCGWHKAQIDIYKRYGNPNQTNDKQ